MGCSEEKCTAEVYCKGMCRLHYKRQYMRTYDNKWKRRTRARYRTKKYGITPEEYEVMLEGQEGRCGICGELAGVRRLAIDHDHLTGKVRGLLCSACNLGLGHFKDDPARLEAAIKYLGG